MIYRAHHEKEKVRENIKGRQLIKIINSLSTWYGIELLRTKNDHRVWRAMIIAAWNIHTTKKKKNIMM